MAKLNSTIRWWYIDKLSRQGLKAPQIASALRALMECVYQRPHVRKARIMEMINGHGNPFLKTDLMAQFPEYYTDEQVRTMINLYATLRTESGYDQAA